MGRLHPIPPRPPPRYAIGTLATSRSPPMRLCRIGPEAAPKAAFYFDTHVVPVATAIVAQSQSLGTSVRIPTKDDLVPLLSDYGVRDMATWLARTPNPPGAIP